MARELDSETAERMVRGEIVPADAPRSFSGVAAAITRARASVAHDAEVPAPLLTAMVRATAAPITPGRAVRSKPILAAKVAGAFVGALSLTGGLAAADVLPASVSEKVDNVVAVTTGAELPGAAERARERAERLQEQLEERIAREAEREAARAAREAERDADDDGHPDNHGAEVSKVARDDSTEGREHGETVSTVARDNRGHQEGADSSGRRGGARDEDDDDADEATTTTVTVDVDDDGDDDDDDRGGNERENGGSGSSGKGRGR